MITLSAERMPTPANLYQAIAEIRSGISVGGGVPKHTEGEDRNGIPCWFWEDGPTVPAYSAKDCPEGKVFLAMLEDMSKANPTLKREKVSGLFECQDCKQSYPMADFMKHDCPNIGETRKRIERRGR